MEHPRIAERAQEKPETTDDPPTFNARLALHITRGFGSMWAFYILVAWMFTWMLLATAGFWLFKFDRYPFNFLLFLSNLIQLWALPVLAVGQQLLARTSDRRALQTFKDAEAILHLSDKTHQLVKINNDMTADLHAAMRDNRSDS